MEKFSPDLQLDHGEAAGYQSIIFFRRFKSSENVTFK